MTVKRVHALVVAAASASSATLALSAGPAEATFPGASGKIVFTSDRDGAQDVYVMTEDGVSQRRLTNTDGSDEYPSWSPDGNLIVFSSQRENLSGEKIFRMSADGSAQTRLTDSTFHDLEPSWSRTQGRIAFRSNRESGDQIFAMNANGSGVVRLTTGGSNLNPVWSPTADTIAFSSDRDGDYEIFTMDGNGDDQRALTSNAAFDSNPDWSPDGTKIAFQSNPDGNFFGNFDIWVMNSDGTGLTQLTNDPAFDSAPAWSPDGTMIAFQSNRDGDFEIYAMAAGGGPATQLTFNTATDRVADWQPLFAGADTTPPVLTVPADIATLATSPAGATVTYTASATDNVDPTPSVTCSHPSGATFPVGTTTVSCTASDGSGNWSDGSFTVTVEAAPNTQPGTNVAVTPVDATTGVSPVTITFSEVFAEGLTTLTTSSSGPPPPTGFQIAGVYYELATTAQFESAEICFSHNSDPPPAVGHFEGGGWTILSLSRPPTANEVCVLVTSFSPFALLEPETPSDDLDAPAIACGAADGSWHGANASIDCTAQDVGSGLADPADAAFTLSTSVPDGTEDADAATGTRQVCDAAGNCAPAGPISGNKIDRRAPMPVLPGSMTVDATTPAGATVNYTASASDGADPNSAVSCSPAPGSVFTIGTSTVACTATDHVGNTANGSFSVTVLGAKEQLDRLLQDVISASRLPAAVKAQLLANLQLVVANFDPANPAHRKAACSALRAFTTALRLLSGHGVPPAQVATWIADANRIRAVLAC
jgi:Tol biopolymer transport system component